MQNIEFTYGTTIGAEHRRAGINNQDNYYHGNKENLFAAVVCDGCSDGGNVFANSGVGAFLFSRWTIKAINELDESGKWIGKVASPRYFQELWKNIMGKCHAFINISGFKENEVSNMMLSTIVGVIITEDKVTIFSCGDGIFMINGEMTVIKPLEGNRPVYPIYRILKSVDIPAPILKKELTFHIQKQIPLSEVSSIIIGTDGAKDFLEGEGKVCPRTGMTIPPTQSLWEQDKYFVNAFPLLNLTRESNYYGCKANNDGTTEIIHGNFPDDITLFVIRKTPESLSPSNEETK